MSAAPPITRFQLVRHPRRPDYAKRPTAGGFVHTDAMKMRFTIRKLLAVTPALAFCLEFATSGWSWLTRKGAVIHRRAVTREIIEWCNGYSRINDNASAIRAAEMIGYIASRSPVPRDFQRSEF